MDIMPLEATSPAFTFFTVGNNNMADARTCEVGAIRAPLTGY